MKRPTVQHRYAVLALLTIAACLGIAAGWVLSNDSHGEAAERATERGWPASVQAAGIAGFEPSLGAGVSPAVKKAIPAVVNISSTKIIRQEGRTAPGLPPLFEEFFGDRFSMPEERKAHSLGSGVIVNQDGHILTNDHVIRGAEEIEVVLSDKRELSAKIVGRDPKSDLALIKVNADTKLPVLELLADSNAVEAGDFVLAIGNPFGLGQTVTFGIVSATGRGGLGIEELEDFIQTDASINVGNSGGALTNLDGELIGINTAIVSRTGGNQGIGFAIPSNMARDVMRQLSERGRVIRGWLGVAIQPVTPTLAKSLGLDDARGALVSNVASDSPASKAGIARGDVIVELESEPVQDARTLQLRIARSDPGDQVDIKVIRDGQRRSFSVELGESESEVETSSGSESASDGEFGLSVQPLTEEIARQLGLGEDVSGVVISAVKPGSPAAAAGLRRGDVIEEVGRRPVTSVRQFESAVKSSGDVVLLLVNRGGQTLFVPLERN